MGCHALAQVLIREHEVLGNNPEHEIPKSVKEISPKVEIKSLLMQSCQWSNWEACTTYGVFALEGMFEVSKNPMLGVEILEKACHNGSEPKACINLERIYQSKIPLQDGLSGVVEANPDKQKMYES